MPDPKKKKPSIQSRVSSRRAKSDDSATLKRLRKSYPNSDVTPIRNSSSYRLVNKKGGGSVTLTPGKRKTKKKK